MIYGLWEHAALAAANNDSKYLFAAVETREDKDCYVVQSHISWHSLDMRYQEYEAVYGIPMSFDTLTLCYEISPKAYNLILARVRAGGWYKLSDLEEKIKEIDGE